MQSSFAVFVWSEKVATRINATLFGAYFSIIGFHFRRTLLNESWFETEKQIITTSAFENRFCNILLGLLITITLKIAYLTYLSLFSFFDGA